MCYPFIAEDVTGVLPPRDFLYMKLEGDPAITLSHGISAIKRYKLGKEKKGSTEKRREDDKVRNDDYVLRDSINMMTYYISNGGRFPDAVQERMDFYNEHIRLKNEVYIPYEILEIVLQEYHPKRAFKGAIEGVIAAARLEKLAQARLEPEGVGTEKWARSHARLAESHGRNVFQNSKDCMQAKYRDQKGHMQSYTKDQLYAIGRSLDLPVSRVMTKKQLCDIITA